MMIFVYVGATLDGTPNGLGRMTWSNGVVFKGELINVLRCGLGDLAFANETNQSGRFQNNEFVMQASFTEIVKIGHRTSSL
jgi:hypothetical protein